MPPPPSALPPPPPLPKTLIWYTAHLSLFFFIVWVKLKANSTCLLSCNFSLFSFLFFLSWPADYCILIPWFNQLVCLTVLFLEIKPNHISIGLLENTSTIIVHKRYGYMPWVLEKTDSLSLNGWWWKIWVWLLSYSKC